MKLVIFGRSVSSSRGNGHATLWRGLCRALAEASHEVVFFEQDTPYYRQARDLEQLAGGDLVLYSGWEKVRGLALRELRQADAAIVTSCCPDGGAAADLLLECERPLRVFYDLDAPLTLAALETGEPPPYLGERGLADFDLVLSSTGGRALQLLEERLGARQAAALHAHVDPLVHRPVLPAEVWRSRLSYLGTYSADRQAKLAELLLAPAAALPDQHFLLAGALQAARPAFPKNLTHEEHLPPGEHAAFYCSSEWTLNVTPDAIARLGYCPSGRLFEAAACGTPLLSDDFEGLDHFFEPGSEIQIVRDRDDVLRALSASEAARRAQADAARRRVLAEHTAERRAAQLIRLLGDATSRRPPAPAAIAAALVMPSR